MARLTHYLLAFAAAITLNFALPRLMPGSPLAWLAGADITALSAEDRETLLARAGLDEPLLRQYARYLADLAQADLGYSYQRAAPVASVLADRLPWTLLLMLTSQTVVLVAGVALGAVAAWHQGRPIDAAVVATVIVFDALPVFWIGMVLLALFAVHWPWLPLFGAESLVAPGTRVARLGDILRHLVLPAATLALGSVAGMALIARTSFSAVLEQPYLRAVRARGIDTARLLWRHALPNALPPITTAAAASFGLAIGGAPLVETVFSYPGLGRLVYDAVLARDYPVLQGAFLLVTTVVLAANALAELVHPWLDPRLQQRASD
jgi:peptide/nickel transport system permease protein